MKEININLELPITPALTFNDLKRGEMFVFAPYDAGSEIHIKDDEGCYTNIDDGIWVEEPI